MNIDYFKLNYNSISVVSPSIIDYLKNSGKLEKYKNQKRIINFDDIVELSCESYINDKLYIKFTSDKEICTIGNFINSFMDGQCNGIDLIGQSVGQTFAFTFDTQSDYEPYPNAHVSLVCDIKSCYGTPDELTLDLVKQLDPTCNSIEEYEEKIREEINKENKETEELLVRDDLIQQVIEQSEFDFTDEEINEAISEYISDFNIDIDQYLIDNNISYMEFVNQFKDDALYTKKQNIVIDYIYNAENLTGEDKYYSVGEFLRRIA